MKFFGCPMSLRVGTISPVTGTNGGESGTLLMNQTGDIIPGKSRKKSKRTRRKKDVR
jgi:ABC-type hemin transport system ATPase subunit